jgi:hypothetical protein
MQSRCRRCSLDDLSWDLEAAGAGMKAPSAEVSFVTTACT